MAVILDAVNAVGALGAVVSTVTLAVALAEEKPMEQALRFASAAAALSVTRLGAQASIPTRAEVEAFLAFQFIDDRAAFVAADPAGDPAPEAIDERRREQALAQQLEPAPSHRLSVHRVTMR